MLNRKVDPGAPGLGAGAQAGRDDFNSGIINYMQVGRLKSKLGSTPNSNEPPLLMQKLACMKLVNN